MNKTAIVTGSSRGIGASIVSLLAKDGYNVVLNYNKSEAIAKKKQEELMKQGYCIETFKADVSKREETKKLVRFTLNKFHNIDVLINNAGITQMKLFTDITDKDWEYILKTNLNSVFYMCQEVLPSMIHQKSGSIINISSIWGLTGASCEVAYSTSKAALNGFTMALAKEVGPSNIRVNAIAPGMIQTDMNQGLTEEELKQITDEIPLQKIGKTQDIAKCISWLIEDEYTTGQIISVNGGWLMA